MKRPRLAFLAALAAMLVLPGCNVILLQFLVPLTAVGGSTIEVVVTANCSGGAPGDRVGAVLQLPAGFTVVGAMTPNQDLGNPIPLTWNDAGLLGLYTQEPGTTLVAFSGPPTSSSVNPIALRVRLLVPPGANGYLLKVALAAAAGNVWQTNDPPAITNFAQITSARHMQFLAVLAAPTQGAPTWVEDVAGLPVYSSSGWGGVAFADVDRNGHQDLGCIARLGNGPHVLLHQGATGWLDQSTGLASSSGRSDVAFGDFNGDGWPDLADGNGRAFLGNGGTAWTAASTGITTTGSEGVAVGDVNHDGFDDIAFGGHFSPRLECWLSQGNGTWLASSSGLPTTQPVTSAQAGGHKVLLRDLNGDGHLDLVWARIQAAGIWLGNGSGGWTEVVNSGLDGHQFWGVDAGDFDGDGLTDLVFGTFSYPMGQGGGPLGIRVYRQQPGPTWVFDPNTNLPTVAGYMDVAVADFDRDGVLDIAAGRAGVGGGLEIWQGLPGGTFVQSLGTGLPAQNLPNPEGLAVGDVDGDTFPDLAVASYGWGVAVYRNQRSGFSRYGEGCSGMAPYPPTIGANGTPSLGNAAFAWTLAGAPPGAFSLLVLGTSRTHLGGNPVLPLPLATYGAPGCSLLAENVAIGAAFADGTGAAAIGMPIPGGTSLLLLPIFGQWAVVSPGANALGVVFSGGGASRIGP